MEFSFILRCLVFVVLIFDGVVHSVKIHEHMTEMEIQNIFHTTPDNVPDYDVSEIIHSVDKRALEVQLLTSNSSIVAYLEPSDSLLAESNIPVWVAVPVGKKDIDFYSMWAEVMNETLEFYQEVSNQSAIVVKRSVDGHRTFMGNVGDLFIRPIPARLRRHVYNSLNITKRAVRDGGNDEISINHHIVYKSTVKAKRTPIPKLNLKTSEEKNVTAKDIVYVSFLVTTDYLIDMLIPKDDDVNVDLLFHRILYVLSYWNAADLMFRPMTNPKIRLRISGIIIGAGREATPYLRDTMRRFGVIDLGLAVDVMYDHWRDMLKKQEMFRKLEFHAILTMTNLAKNDGSGITYEPICSQFGRHRSISIVCDGGDFRGIQHMVHQIGHLFGLSHDVNIVAGCEESQGYIMQESDEFITDRNLHWSPCSLAAMSKFFAENDCADKKPTAADFRDYLKVPLPGKLAHAWHQCTAIGFDGSCPIDERRCLRLKCFKENYGKIKWEETIAPAPGTHCGTNKICLDGQCVNDPDPNTLVWRRRGLIDWRKENLIKCE